MDRHRRQHRNQYMSKQTRFYLFGLLIFLWVDPACALPCVKPLRLSLSDEIIASRKEIVKETCKHIKAVQDIPPEIANTAPDNFALYYKHALLDPLGSLRASVFDAYFGNNIALNGTAVFALPQDDRLLCPLLPANIVFLSDGVTHHYATVYDIDYETGNNSL
jgi:hypothetical protein